MKSRCYSTALLIVSLVSTSAVASDFETDIKPLLKKYCERCHSGAKAKGEFDLTHFKSEDSIRGARIDWRRALTVVREDEMPPDDPLPTEAERATLVEWLTDVTRIDWSKVRNPGHVTIPRLTRDEYNNTMRDLLGLDLKPGDQLSEDGEGQSGFNTDRDALFMTPDQLEKYFDAAERALDAVSVLEREPVETRLESETMFMTETKETPKQFGSDFFGFVLNRGQMTLYDSVAFPVDGIYEFNVRALSTGGPTGTRLRINDVTQGDLVVPTSEPTVYSLRTFVSRGSHQIAWNIQVPDRRTLERLKAQAAAKAASEAAKQTDASETPAPVKYRDLPKNARSIVNEQSPKTFPKYPATGEESEQLRALIKTVDSAALGLQRPYEWLRLLKTDGQPSEIVRFKGYIAERTKTLEDAKTKLAEALNESRDAFDKRYRTANAERLADNQQLLERVRDITEETVRKQQAKAAAKNNDKPGSVAIDWIEIRGPLAPEDAPEQSPVFIVKPGGPVTEDVAAQMVIDSFVRRAFRRSVTTNEVAKFVALYSNARMRGDNYEDGLKLALTAVLVSPQFLYRPELGPGNDEFKLDAFQVASRLSYFLWMSMPDETLIALAESGELVKPDVLTQQTQRMLSDSKVRSFATTFTGQWLGFAPLGTSVRPDPVKFPEFTSELVEAMKLETVLSFESLLQDNRSVLELLDSRETWLNDELASHYGIKNVRGPQMRKVSLDDRTRGGLLGMASVLTATSGPTRTSPVIRGKWVLETLLGRTLPEPPADAGELPVNAGEARTLREELLLHRRNPTCATCHDKIDPIGFGLENFDAIGRFRDAQAGQPIDARGELPGGIVLDGPVALKEYLGKERRTEFLRNLTQRLLSFGLGRELQYFDEPVLEKIVAAVEADGYSSQTLITQIVLSYPFRNQTGRLPDEL